MIADPIAEGRLSPWRPTTSGKRLLRAGPRGTSSARMLWQARARPGPVAVPRRRTHTEAMPVVIYRSVNRDGETYALEPRSLELIQRELGTAVHARPRVFIAHETRADYEHVHADIVQQVVQLLTGVTEERLRPLGGVTFRDPVTDQDLLRAG